MTGPDERQRRQHATELALARQLAELRAAKPLAKNPRWTVAVFHHPAASVGCAFVSTQTDSDLSLRIRIAAVTGLGAVAGVLAGQCCLELLDRAEGVDLVESNRHFTANPPGENAMLAAGVLRFHPEDPTWIGSFAGLAAPLSVHSDGRVELLRGTGPFLGLTETTFPILRGTVEPGARLFLLVGSGAGERSTDSIERFKASLKWSMDECVERIGRELADDLESGFGLTLLGIERRALSTPSAVIE